MTSTVNQIKKIGHEGASVQHNRRISIKYHAHSMLFCPVTNKTYEKLGNILRYRCVGARTETLGIRIIGDSSISSTIGNLPESVDYRIKQLQQLKYDWNSYGAKPVSINAVRLSRALLSEVFAKSNAKGVEKVFIAPRSNGGIQLDWNINENELSLRISPEGSDVEYLLNLSTGTEREGYIHSSDDLDKLLKEIS